MTGTEATSRGSRPSLIESFELRGLYGYRTISLKSEYAASILIAQNGSGKTTLLAALDAVLRRQFSRLRELQFHELACKMRGIDEIVISADSILKYVKNDVLASEARGLDATVERFLALMEESISGVLQYPEEDIISKLMRRFDYSRGEITKYFHQVANSITSTIPQLHSAGAVLSRELAETEIVYLPTYRRIELALIAQSPDPYRRSRRPQVPGVRPGLHSADIQFGLTDIVDRLEDMNRQIVITSSQGYQELSADIINELIDGRFDAVASNTEDIPTKEELELFFSRLKGGPRRGFGPYLDVSIPNIEKIYTGNDISDERNKFLRYFLLKLNTVIQSTHEVETQVTTFIDSCNKYLASSDVSAAVRGDELRAVGGESDSKQLRVNRRDLDIYVATGIADRRIPIDALSSGEKQMVSLFAKLFLYPKNKIVLVDEPELSLSIDWQRQILVDVMNAPLCSQLIAITHSPFVFDNALEPFARSLSSMVSSIRTGDLFDAASRQG